MAVVALLDHGLQGAPAAEGLWRGLGLWCGLWLWRGLGHGYGPLGLAAASFLIAFLIAFCLAFGAVVVAVLAELFARRPADGRAHGGDVAQQEVEVVAAVWATGRSVGRPEKSTPASARLACQPAGRRPRRVISGWKKEPEQLTVLFRSVLLSPSTPRQWARTHHTEFRPLGKELRFQTETSI